MSMTLTDEPRLIVIVLNHVMAAKKNITIRHLTEICEKMYTLKMLSIVHKIGLTLKTFIHILIFHDLCNLIRPISLNLNIGVNFLVHKIGLIMRREPN